MHNNGGAKPGAGRPPGAKNKATLTKEDAIRELTGGLGTFTGTAREFLQMVMESDKLSASMRLDAAKTLIQYEEPKLSTVTIAEKRGVERETVKQELAGLSSDELAEIVKLGTAEKRPMGRPRKALPDDRLPEAA